MDGYPNAADEYVLSHLTSKYSKIAYSHMRHGEKAGTGIWNVSVENFAAAMMLQPECTDSELRTILRTIRNDISSLFFKEKDPSGNWMVFPVFRSIEIQEISEPAKRDINTLELAYEWHPATEKMRNLKC